MLPIRAFRGAEVHRDAMLYNFVLFQNLIENAQRTSAINHEIFGYDFEPVHNRLARKNVVVMLRAQTDPDSVVRVAVKAIGRHLRLRWLTRKDGASYKKMIRKSVEGRLLGAGPQHQTVDTHYDRRFRECQSGIFEPSVAQ